MLAFGTIPSVNSLLGDQICLLRLFVSTVITNHVEFFFFFCASRPTGVRKATTVSAATSSSPRRTPSCPTQVRSLFSVRPKLKMQRMFQMIPNMLHIFFSDSCWERDFEMPSSSIGISRGAMKIVSVCPAAYIVFYLRFSFCCEMGRPTVFWPNPNRWACRWMPELLNPSTKTETGSRNQQSEAQDLSLRERRLVNLRRFHVNSSRV